MEVSNNFIERVLSDKKILPMENLNCVGRKNKKFTTKVINFGSMLNSVGN